MKLLKSPFFYFFIYLLINILITYFGRIYFPENFKPLTTGFIENYLVLIMAELVVFAVVSAIVCAVLLILPDIITEFQLIRDNIKDKREFRKVKKLANKKLKIITNYYGVKWKQFGYQSVRLTQSDGKFIIIDKFPPYDRLYDVTIKYIFTLSSKSIDNMEKLCENMEIMFPEVFLCYNRKEKLKKIKQNQKLTLIKLIN